MECESEVTRRRVISSPVCGAANWLSNGNGLQGTTFFCGELPGGSGLLTTNSRTRRQAEHPPSRPVPRVSRRLFVPDDFTGILPQAVRPGCPYRGPAAGRSPRMSLPGSRRRPFAPDVLTGVPRCWRDVVGGKSSEGVVLQGRRSW